MSLFLLAMATAKRASELQALSFSVSFQSEDLVLYYDPFFRAKTESVSNPLPRSSHHGIWNMPCHSTFDSSLLTVVPCLPHVHLGLTTFVALPHLSITTVISLCPTLCRLLRGSRTVFSLLVTLRRFLPHRIISSSLAPW